MPGFDDCPEGLPGIRSDSWANILTGLGADRDKTTYARPTYVHPLGDEECSALYHGGGIERRVAELLPSTALKNGWTTQCDETEFSEQIDDRFRDLALEEQFRDAWIFARVFGGCALYLGVNDGGRADQPLIESEVRSFDFVDLYDKRQCYPIDWYWDPKEPRFGRPKTYTLVALRGGVAQVHESRLMLFPGARTAQLELLANNFWDHSNYMECYEALRSFSVACKSVELLMEEASQFVYGLRGLTSKIANGSSPLIQERMRLIDASRSVARAIVIDSESETATRINTTFSGIGDAWDRMATQLAAIVGCPVTVLTGISPAGMNATGQSDQDNWNSVVNAESRRVLRPRVERAIRLMRRALRIDTRVTVAFPSLWNESPSQKTQRQFQAAQRDALLISNDVIAPEEARRQYEVDEWTGDLSLESRTTLVGNRLPPSPIDTGAPAINPIGGAGSPALNIGWRGKRDPTTLGRSMPSTSGNPWPTGAVKPGDEDLSANPPR